MNLKTFMIQEGLDEILLENLINKLDTLPINTQKDLQLDTVRNRVLWCYINKLNGDVLTSLIDNHKKLSDYNVKLECISNIHKLPIMQIDFVVYSQKLFINKVTFINLIKETSNIEFIKMLEAGSCPITDLDIDYLLQKIINKDWLIHYPPEFQVKIDVSCKFITTQPASLLQVGDVDKDGYLLLTDEKIKTVLVSELNTI